MSLNHTGRPVRFVAIAASFVLALATVGLVGCGGTVESPGGPAGTGAPAVTKVVSDSVRGEVLDRLKSMGVTFDAGLVSVNYGADQSRIVVNGPLTGPVNLATGAKTGAKTTFKEIDLALQQQNWVVVKTLK
jgi:hypothetical protein